MLYEVALLKATESAKRHIALASGSNIKLEEPNVSYALYFEAMITLFLDRKGQAKVRCAYIKYFELVECCHIMHHIFPTSSAALNEETNKRTQTLFKDIHKFLPKIIYEKPVGLCQTIQTFSNQHFKSEIYKTQINTWMKTIFPHDVSTAYLYFLMTFNDKI